MKFPPGGGRIPIGWSEGKLSYGDEAPGAARACNYAARRPTLPCGQALPRNPSDGGFAAGLGCARPKPPLICGYDMIAGGRLSCQPDNADNEKRHPATDPEELDR